MSELNDEGAWLREEIAERRYLARHICRVQWAILGYGDSIILHQLEIEDFKSNIRKLPKMRGLPMYCCVVDSSDNPKIFIYPRPYVTSDMGLRVEYGDRTVKDVEASDYEKDWADPA